VKVTVQYFAILREQRGLSAETLETAAETARALYEELREKHSFSLKPELVKASVNLQISPLETALKEGDEIVFVPPVAGG
jgi:molybdopterin converting factor small subunit